MINRGKIRNFSWAKPNIVNKAALRRRDTLVRHIDPPAKHDGLLCRLKSTERNTSVKIKRLDTKTEK